MKKISLIIALVSCMALTSVGLDSCKGVEWDTQETLVGMSESWARIYVEDLMRDYGHYKDVAKDSTRKVQYTVTFNDTVAVESIFRGMIGGDSVDITTTIVLKDTTMMTVTDGYRYADNITAHMFTADPGIIDYNGKLHFDFYKTDGMIPWAWTEITYSKTDDSDVIPYLRNSKFGWY
jgi:hypothetical protein